MAEKAKNNSKKSMKIDIEKELKKVNIKLDSVIKQGASTPKQFTKELETEEKNEKEIVRQDFGSSPIRINIAQAKAPVLEKQAVAESISTLEGQIRSAPSLVADDSENQIKYGLNTPKYDSSGDSLRAAYETSGIGQRRANIGGESGVSGSMFVQENETQNRRAIDTGMWQRENAPMQNATQSTADRAREYEINLPMKKEARERLPF